MVAALAASGTVPSAAADLGLRVGSTGVGPEVSFALGPRTGLRLAAGFWEHDDRFRDTGVDYDAELSLASVGLLGDWHPTGGPFRLTAGAVWNDNALELSAPLRDLLVAEAPDLPAVDLGTVRGSAQGDALAPYAGLGWALAPGGVRRWGGFLDLGVFYHGSPDVELTAETLIEVPEIFLRPLLEREEQALEAELDDYRWFPVVAFGLTRRF